MPTFWPHIISELGGVPRKRTDFQLFKFNLCLRFVFLMIAYDTQTFCKNQAQFLSPLPMYFEENLEKSVEIVNSMKKKTRNFCN